MMIRIDRSYMTKVQSTMGGCLLGVLVATTAYSDDLKLADTALEVLLTDPNIVILTDDSGSMDLSIMTLGPDNGTDGELTFLNRLYSYAHPDPGASGVSPATNIFTREEALTEEYLRDVRSIPYPYHGAWRAWNKDYNKVYYDPDITYKPWVGLNASGTEYGNASPTAALYNPYRPTNGSLNLTTTMPNYSSRYGSNNVTVAGFYPARYYIWDDSNTLDNNRTPAASHINNGLVDADDDHKLVEIRNGGTCTTGAICPNSFVRTAYDIDTGIGRSDCGAPGGAGTVTCTYAQEIQNFTNWFTYYRKRDLVAKANFGFVISGNTSARIGYATIHNNDSVSRRVSTMNASAIEDGNKKNLMAKIYQTRPGGGTPLRQNLRDVGRYYECRQYDIFGSSTDSSPTLAPKDIGSIDETSVACPIFASPAGACQQNYTILMTDGFYNGNSPGIGDADSDNDSDYDGGATADSVEDTLADVAMAYYERDLQPGIFNDVQPTQKDMDRYTSNGAVYPKETGSDRKERMAQHMSTYTVGFGVKGSVVTMPDDPVAAFNWHPSGDDRDKIDDLMHAAYNGRGDFLEATNPATLQKGFAKIFDEIGKTTGAASAIAFNTQQVSDNALLFSAWFNTRWNSGELAAYSLADGIVSNPDGSIQLPDPAWLASEKLKSQVNKASDSRTIITYHDIGVGSKGVPFLWDDLTDGNGSQHEALNLPQPLGVPLPQTLGQDRLNWLRGWSEKEGDNYHQGNLRRRDDEEASVLGDIVHSAPLFIGTPEASGRDNAPYPNDPNNLYSQFKAAHKNRSGRVYVGANDGMLHAFEAQTGREAFAYIPNLVFGHLSELTRPDYQHRFYVDVTPSANDVFMNGAWKTILVSGLGKGGKGYFALDVTNPASFASEGSAAANVLWEFAESDSGGPGKRHLGYTYGRPYIDMTNAESGGEKRWAVIFGNGYNNQSDNGEAAIYIAFVDGGTDGVWTEGSDYIKLTTGKGKTSSTDGSTPNGISGVVGIDRDLDGTVDLIYAGDFQGNMYRFDISSKNTGQWKTAGVLFRATYGNTVQPITNAPAAVKHPDQNGFIIIFGTGGWLQESDRSDTSIQSIYGVWDDLGNLPANEEAVSKNDLVEQEFENEREQEHGFIVRSHTNHPVSWRKTGNKVLGWFIDLDMPRAGSSSGVQYPGERAVRNFQVRESGGGNGNFFVFVNTIIPSTTSCTPEGGYELGFNAITGGSGSEVIFDLNGDLHFTSLDNVKDGDQDADIVTGRKRGLLTDAAFFGNMRVSKDGEKLVGGAVNIGQPDLTGRHSWREIIF